MDVVQCHPRPIPSEPKKKSAENDQLLIGQVTVIVEKSRGEGSLMEQDTIENVS